MYLDTRNNNKVIIVKEGSKDTVIVKRLKDGKRYLMDKRYLKELKI